MGKVGASILSAFMYRCATVFQLTHLMHKRKAIIALVLMHILYSSPVVLMSLYAGLSNPQTLELDTKEVRMRYDLI